MNIDLYLRIYSFVLYPFLVMRKHFCCDCFRGSSTKYRDEILSGFGVICSTVINKKFSKYVYASFAKEKIIVKFYLDDAKISFTI